MFLCTGESITGEEAYNAGLISKLVSEELVQAEVLANSVTGVTLFLFSSITQRNIELHFRFLNIFVFVCLNVCFFVCLISIALLVSCSYLLLDNFY